MTISKNRGGFTLVELLVVIAIIGTLVGLLLPAVQSAREAARRSACSNNSKQLGLGLLNFESARKRLPAANVSGATTYVAGTAGFSWITQILPFLEETNLYTQMSSNSTRFSVYSSTNGSATSLPQLVCPSFAGNKANGSATSSGAAITNYKGAAGTGYTTNVPHSASNLGGVLTAEHYGSESTAPWTGITLAMITDGTSKTFAIAESREEAYGAWQNGTHSWVTAGNGTATTTGNVVTLPSSTTAVSDNSKTAGTFSGYGTNIYGASSNHQAGITLHTYADGHVGQVTPEIDQALYGGLFTRGGSESTGEQP
jgi:prepilin-type N-terminal cleavage/methylation domain-containing protein